MFRCHCIFINTLKSVQTLIFYEPLQIFHSKFSQVHFRIVFIPCTIQPVCFCSFLALCILLLYLLICELHGSNSNVAAHFCSTVLKQYYRSAVVTNRRATRTLRAAPRYCKLILIALMQCVKRIILGCSCPGWKLSWLSIVVGGSCPRCLLSGSSCPDNTVVICKENFVQTIKHFSYTFLTYS